MASHGLPNFDPFYYHHFLASFERFKSSSQLLLPKSCSPRNTSNSHSINPIINKPAPSLSQHQQKGFELYLLQGMEYQKQRFEKKGNPPPRRGQVKARIFGSLVRSILPSSSNNQIRKPQTPEASSTMLTPGTSGYTSEDCSAA